MYKTFKNVAGTHGNQGMTKINSDVTWKGKNPNTLTWGRPSKKIAELSIFADRGGSKDGSALSRASGDYFRELFADYGRSFIFLKLFSTKHSNFFVSYWLRGVRTMKSRMVLITLLISSSWRWTTESLSKRFRAISVQISSMNDTKNYVFTGLFDANNHRMFLKAVMIKSPFGCYLCS